MESPMQPGGGDAEAAEEGDGMRPALPVLLAELEGVGGFFLSYGFFIVDVGGINESRGAEDIN